jgi:YD repeat-containing protein
MFLFPTRPRRPTSATNPETGTVYYTYDADGNVQTKTSPAPNQPSGSATEVITYCYDALNRLTAKGYSSTAQNATPKPDWITSAPGTTAPTWAAGCQKMGSSMIGFCQGRTRIPNPSISLRREKSNSSFRQ